MRETLARVVRETLARVVLGNHPHNTVFSFNYHNVRHVVGWMRDVGHQVGPVDLVVDVGGGAAPYRRYIQAGRYVVVDLEDTTHAGVEYLPGAAEDLPVADGSVDVVVMNQVLEHVVDPVKVVAEARRVLKPGGWFVGSVPHVSPVHLEPHDYQRYTDLGLRQLLDGFEDVRVDGSGGPFTAAALLITMDWMVSKRDGGPQRNPPWHPLVFAPVVGLLNVVAGWLDRVRETGRCPANLCWSAVAGRIDDEGG